MRYIAATLAAVAAALLPLACALTTIRGSVVHPSTPLSPLIHKPAPLTTDITSLPITARVDLTAISGPSHSAFILSDGSFSIPDVEAGAWILETRAAGWTFSPLILMVEGDSVHVQTYHPARLALSPSSSPSLPYPVVLRANGREEYFSAVPGTNVLGMLKSPMVLMMLFSAGMMYVMPKMMANMDIDPELAKEMAETRKKMSNMQNMDFVSSLSGMLAGGNADEQDVAPKPAPVARAGTPGGGGGGGGGGKKRRK